MPRRGYAVESSEMHVSFGTYVRYQAPATGSSVVRWFLWAVVAVQAAGALALVAADQAVAGLIVLLVAVFDAVLFWFIVPRSYQITDTALVVVFSGPLRWRVPLSSITTAEVSKARGRVSLFAVKFATSGRSTVLVRRRGRRPVVVISPERPEHFVDELRAAIDEGPR